MIVSTISRYSGDLDDGIEIGEPSQRRVGSVEVVGSVDPAAALGASLAVRKRG